MDKKIYQDNWFIILTLILVFPVGIFLMWKYADWKNIYKIIVVIIIILCSMAIFFIKDSYRSATKTENSQVIQVEHNYNFAKSTAIGKQLS